MIRLTFFIIFSITFIACKTETTKNRNLNILVELAQSYKYDLENETYTVFYTNKPATEIRFKLSSEEIKQIIDKYYDLDIDKVSGVNKETGTIYIEDECMIMPKITTILTCKTANGVQKIEIDTGCDDFYLFNTNKANRIKVFLKFIEDLIEAKPQLKNAPKSNILYM